MKCARCDHPLPEGDRFCGRCGLARSTDGRPVDPLLGITVAGRYRIERRIGVGGMGTVYLGTHTRLGQKVAIKVLHERHAGNQQLNRRFENEALTYGRITHPNLVALHDFGRAEDGTSYMVLEYCPGTPLGALLRREKRLDPVLAADIVTQVAQGLGAAHAAGIVHRDLKPENVVLMETRPGRYHVKLLDFGIAKCLEDEGPRLTQAGMVFGTPEYMSPEQARGERVDERSDIYALGCMLYELLTGDPPFVGGNKMKVMHRQATEVPERPSARAPQVALGEAYEQIVMRCLEKTPGKRFANAAELIEAFERALGTERLTPAPLPPAVVEASAPPPPRAPTMLVEEPVVALAADSAGFGGLGGPPPGMRGGPSATSLALAAALFCGVVVAAAWMFSRSPTPQSPVTARAEPASAAEPEPERPFPAAAPPPAPPPSVAPPSVAEPKPEEKQAPTAATPSEPPVKKPEPPKVQPPKAEPAVAKAEPPKAEPPKAGPPKAPPAPVRGESLATGRKALRMGKLDEASAAADSILAGAPDDTEAQALRRKVNDVRKAMAVGRVAFEGADCVQALRHLEPVLEAAPGAEGVSHMVSRCRDALPPRQL